MGPSQCAKAGSNYFGKLLNVGYILHSPVGRCKTTARLVFTEHCRSINGNAPIQPVQRLCTCGGCCCWSAAARSQM